MSQQFLTQVAAETSRGSKAELDPTKNKRDTMRSTTVTTDPFAVRRPAPAANESYLGSSLDLQAGLRVQELLASACPPEVIRELARMRRAWGTPAAPAAA